MWKRLRRMKVRFVRFETHKAKVVHGWVKFTAHVIACIDGEKEPPRWLHRSHRIGHILFLGTGVAVISGEFFHYHDFVAMMKWPHIGSMGGVCVVECLTFFMGTSFEGFDEVDPD